LLRSGFYTLLEKGSGLMFSLVTAMLLLRGLTKEDFAAWGLFLVITYFLEMGRSGLLQNALMTFVARHPQEEVPAIATTALVLNVGFSAVSIVAMLLGGQWLATEQHLPQFAALLPAYYASNAAMVVLYQSNFLQQAHQEFRGIFWGTFLHRGSLFAWVVWSKATGRALYLPDLGWVFFVGICLGAIASLFFSGKYFPRRFVWQMPWLVRFWNYGKYVLGTNLSAMLYKNIDKLVLGQLAGPVAFAVYDAAGKVTQMVEAPSFSIASAVFPAGARMAQQEGNGALRDLYEQSVGAILAIVLPFLLLSVAFASCCFLLGRPMRMPQACSK
jgi:lipopolysaccharide exporter